MNKPKLRFPEFTDDWKLCKISELCSVATGKSNTQDKVEDGEYPFYVRSPIVERSTKYLYDEEAIITVGDGVGTGKVFHYVNGKYDLHQRCYRMYNFSDELNAHYFYYVFSKSFYKRVRSMTAKTSVDSVRMEMITDMKISIPTIEEQQKIASLFTELDALIQSAEKELEGYKELKQGMLQKMFPKNGEKVPEIRFPGFTGDWEQCKLIDLVDVLDGDRGKNYPTSDDFDISGHTLFLNASNVTNDGFLFQDNQFITEEKSNSMGNGKLEEDDIVVTSRGSLGHIAWYNADISNFIPYARINSGMLILRNKKKVETEYLYHFMKSSKGQLQISFISSGSAQPQLTKKGVEELKVILPTRRDEQVQLGHYFSNLDNLIALQQKEIDGYKELKKGLLQQMLC